jgi:hypothetical protein
MPDWRTSDAPVSTFPGHNLQSDPFGSEYPV